jgi:hypothetical protein
MSQTVYVLTETSKAGDTLLGVFSSMEELNRLLPSAESGRLADYRVELQILDEPFDIYTPWQVSLSRAGEFLGVEPIIACSCCDEDLTVRQASYVDDRAGCLRIAVWARTKGRAIDATEALYRDTAIEEGWPQTFSPIPPVHTESLLA